MVRDCPQWHNNKPVGVEQRQKKKKKWRRDALDTLQLNLPLSTMTMGNIGNGSSFAKVKLMMVMVCDWTENLPLGFASRRKVKSLPVGASSFPNPPPPLQLNHHHHPHHNHNHRGK